MLFIGKPKGRSRMISNDVYSNVAHKSSKIIFGAQENGKIILVAHKR